MIDILNIILPVFLIIALGYILARIKFVSEDAVKAINLFAQGVAIPALLFLAAATTDLSILLDYRLLLAYYIPATIVFGVGTVAARLMFSRRPGEAVAVGFIGLFSNSVLLGLSIVERALGDAGLAINYALIAFHAPFCYLLGISVMEVTIAEGRSGMATVRAVIRSIFSNNLTAAIIAGFAVNLTGLSLPTVAFDALEMLKEAALPTAVFALGGTLARYSITRNMPEIALISLIKLALFPALVWASCTYLFGITGVERAAAVIMSAMAPGVNAYVFAAMYDRALATAAGSIVFATTVSIFSASIWLWILGI